MGTANPDQTASLWLKIDQLHLNFLKSEESTRKIDIRKKLEGYIHQYMCLVPQDRKFCNPATSEIIWTSARWVPNFSFLKAASAFEAIEKYAANLINQPWRKEYKEIKQYGGFYKHQVESNLSGAEKLFQMMGYAPSGNETLVLNGSVDQDNATTVARDCVLAYVECQIVVSIVQAVSAQFPCSWEEVLEFRRDHVGGPEQATRALIYLKNQLQYQLQRGQPAQLLPYLPTFNNNAGSGDRKRRNGLEAIGSVPTGNLVEVDTTEGVDATEWNAPIPLTIKQYEEEQRKKSEKKDSGNPDSWDYVYRELENIGYTKDQAERPDVIEMLLTKLKEQRKMKSLERRFQEEAPQVPVRERRNAPPPLETCDPVPPPPLPVFREKSQRHSRPLMPPSLPSPSPPTASPPTPSVSAPRSPPKLPQKKRSSLRPIVVASEVQEVRYGNHFGDAWECHACTYLNRDGGEICEMCSKTKIGSPDLSQDESSRKNASSGTDLEYYEAETVGEHDDDSVQCPKCTLLNDPKLRVCDVCGASLHIAPLNLNSRPRRKS